MFSASIPKVRYYRSNGHKIYERMFGPSNMTFTCMGYNFIVFDDVVWENSNKSPRFDWLQAELTKSDAPSVLLTHIPPWADQLEGQYNLTFAGIIAESKLILCLHGHNHSFCRKIYAGVPAIVADDIAGREYYIVKLYDMLFEIEHFSF